MQRLLALACLMLLWGTADADPLYESTNLEQFGVPDVIAEGVLPYDQRVFDGGRVISGKQCCQRDMYRTNGRKVVLVSHEGKYFLAFLIVDDQRHMYYAVSEGVFEERPLEQGTKWEIPGWVGS